MNIEREDKPFIRRGNSEYGTPLFVFEEIDPKTGIERKKEKTMYAEGTRTFYKQEDVFPSSDLMRTISRSSSIRGEDAASQELSRITEEEIEIKKIDKGETSFRIFVAKYAGEKGEEISMESVSFAKSLWNGVKCAVYYNPDTGNIRDISIYPTQKELDAEDDFDMITINLEHPPYFEVTDTNQAISKGLKKREKIDFSKVFESEDFELALEDFETAELSGDKSFLLKVKNMRDQTTISLVIVKTIGIDELYALASTEEFTGWEKAIEKANEYLCFS